MKNHNSKLIFFPAIIVLLSALGVYSQETKAGSSVQNIQQQKIVKNSKLREELLERMKKDQAVRMEATKHPAGRPLPEELVERFRAVGPRQ